MRKIYIIVSRDILRHVNIKLELLDHINFNVLRHVEALSIFSQKISELKKVKLLILILHTCTTDSDKISSSSRHMEAIHQRAND